MGGYTIHEEVLGRLTWDDADGWWAGEVELAPERPVAIALVPDGGEPFALLRRARRTLEAVRDLEPGLRLRAAEDKVGLYNRVWSEGLPITEEDFADRLTLESILFFPDGRAELCYDDGDLFQGRPLLVTVGDDGSFERAALGE
jgi:hypothetical protein